MAEATGMSRRRFVVAGGAAGACAAFLTGAQATAHGRAGAAASAHARYRDAGDTLVLTVPATATSPGYTVVVDKSPFRITTRRDGSVVLRTTAGVAGSSGPAAFRTAAGSWAPATTVAGATWHDGVLDLTLATTEPGSTVAYRITPGADRYRTAWSVLGQATATQVACHYALDSAGHWYGQGEAMTADGGPYIRQPWPLDSGTVRDKAMSPAEYLMTEPFWFTQRGTGLWVDTEDVMDVSINAVEQGVFGCTLTRSAAMDCTVFVERTPRDVYEDYVGITGTPAKSDATGTQYAKPLWNSWAQSYTGVSQDSLLAWAKGLHDAGVPGHTIQMDDGWMSHYGDFTFNGKFPDPKAMSDEIHAMGYGFGIWVTLWINTDADNFGYAADHGYLLRSRTDPGAPGLVTWWNGTAGIVDLANPAARDWYTGNLRTVQQAYGVDGFKFDTRFFDETCAPYPGHTSLDYLELGAQLCDGFDLQGAGVRIHWTGSQKHGFVTRQIDKGTGWDSLRAAVAQNLAISTVGYPFVETDMIGGSLDKMPPAKEVLVRWAQAASLMPLMYCSTSPLGVSNSAGTRAYDQETVDLYTAAVETHERLAPYIEAEARRAVRTGEPIMKPLFFNHPRDEAAYTIDDEWLLGDALLAAPVLGDQARRDIHLPPGRWFDVLHRRTIHGPADLTGYAADLSRTPVFVLLDAPETGTLMSALCR
ncbi:glycoside hydrolase family 31 protein [Streptomyces sp. HPF1205]|uniref:glycoside hydrolase family 31 protein n=1 Tax=Streptomyces sp. HPF1205 TaxID=2873262 RepID=UPI001CED47B7|nr:glycoside hydrolase family 31 protein [Streptomyces sp. HPF1205]